MAAALGHAATIIQSLPATQSSIMAKETLSTAATSAAALLAVCCRSAAMLQAAHQFGGEAVTAAWQIAGLLSSLAAAFWALAGGPLEDAFANCRSGHWPLAAQPQQHMQ